MSNYFGFPAAPPSFPTAAAQYGAYAAAAAYPVLPSTYGAYVTAAPVTVAQTPTYAYSAAPVSHVSAGFGGGSTSYYMPASGATSTVSAAAYAPYSGYDAAVYSAATSYIAEKASGGTNLGTAPVVRITGGFNYPGRAGAGGAAASGFRGGGMMKPNQRGGGGQFRRDGGKPTGPRPQQTMHYCEVCKISCAGPQTYKEHLEGSKHKKKEQMQTHVEKAGSRNKTSYKCDLCSVTSTSHDSYQAHLRGAKHQKTLKLHQQMGKPVPNTVLTVVPSKSQTDAKVSESDSEVEGALPVGEDYIEPIRSDDGRMTHFKCKLCDCSFSDVGAKDMHLKGRRHRLQFKKKVNPELLVEMPRSQFMQRGRRDNRGGRFGGYRNERYPPSFGPPVPLLPPPFLYNNEPQTNLADENDRYLMHKHGLIYPTEEQLAAVQRIVNNTEKALKNVSDYFAEVDKQSLAPKKEPTEATTTSEESQLAAAATVLVEEESERRLKGVMRVGMLAKGLLLRDTMIVQLVVLCSEKPTRTILKKVQDLLPAHFEVCGEKYQLAMAPEDAAIVVTPTTEPKMVLQVIFTSLLYKEGEVAAADAKPDPPDVLNKQKCISALACLKQAKWFQATTAHIPSCLVVLRVFRDLCTRVPTWSPLSTWSLELLVQKVVASCNIPLSPSEAFRRVFEAVSSGILLDSGPGIVDMCDKEFVDTVSQMTRQQREDITASAQHALRLIAFGQIHKVLGVDVLPKEPVLRDRKRSPEQPNAEEIAEQTVSDAKRPHLEGSEELLHNDEHMQDAIKSEPETSSTN